MSHPSAPANSSSVALAASIAPGLVALDTLTAARDRYLQGADGLAKQIAGLQADRLATLGAADALTKLIAEHAPRDAGAPLSS